MGRRRKGAELLTLFWKRMLVFGRGWDMRQPVSRADHEAACAFRCGHPARGNKAAQEHRCQGEHKGQRAQSCRHGCWGVVRVEDVPSAGSCLVTSIASRAIGHRVNAGQDPDAILILT